MFNKEIKKERITNVKKKKPNKALRIHLFLIVIIVSISAIVVYKWKTYPYCTEKVPLDNGGYYITKYYKKNRIVKGFDGEKHEEQGLELARSYYDAAGKPCFDVFGWHKYEYEYDSKGNNIRTYFYEKGKTYELCRKDFYDGFRGEHSGWALYNSDGKLTANKYGIAKEISEGYGLYYEKSMFGVDGELTNGSYGWARFKREGDSIMYFNSDNQPIFKGNKSIDKFFDNNGNLKNNSEGWAYRTKDNGKIKYYDEEKRLVKWYNDNPFSGWSICEYSDHDICFYDSAMNRVNCKAGWSILDMQKLSEGQVAFVFYDKNGNLAYGNPDDNARRNSLKWSIYINQYGDEKHSIWCDDKEQIISEDSSSVSGKINVYPEMLDGNYYCNYLKKILEEKLLNYYDSRGVINNWEFPYDLVGKN